MLEIQRIDRELLQHPRYSSQSWIGVGLDGTLAKSAPDTDPRDIGTAIPPMLKRVRYWIKTGRTVKIFTARAGDAQDEERIHQWCLRHGLPKLEVTNRKDYGMIALWDELAVGVVRNIGVPILPVQMTFWQSLRLQLLLLVGRNAVMKVDTRNVQDQFEAPQKNGREFFKFDG